MWDYLKNHIIVIFLLGILLLVIAIIGNVTTQWICFNLNTFRAISIGSLGFICFSTGFYNLFIKKAKVKEDLHEDILINGDHYRWDWAGQNWNGQVKFKKDENGKLKMNLKISKESLVTNKNGSIQLLLKPDVAITVDEGNIEIDNGVIKIKGLEINKHNFDIIEHKDGSLHDGFSSSSSEIQIISGELLPIPAFAGKIKYTKKNTGESWFGDMVIVKYQQKVYFDTE
jgi:hypothetical protein